MKKHASAIAAMLMLVLLATVPSPAQEIASYPEMLPEDTFLVMTIPAVDEIKTFFQHPRIKPIMDAMFAQEDFSQKFDEAMTRFSEKTGIDHKRLYERLTGDITFAMLNLTQDQSELQVALLIGMQEDGRPLIDELNSLLQLVTEDEGITYDEVSIAGHTVFETGTRSYVTATGGHLAIFSNEAAALKVLGDGSRLSDSTDFQRHAALVGLNSGVSMFVNTAPFVAMIEQQVLATGSSDNAGVQAAMLFIDELGLKQIRSASFTMPVLPGQPMKMFVLAPGYNGMLSKIFSSRPVGREAATLIANGRSTMSAVSIQDMTLIVDYVLTLIKKIEPSFTREQYDAILASFSEQTGIDLQADVIDAMGNVLAFSAEFINVDVAEDITPFTTLRHLNMEFLWSLKSTERFAAVVDLLFAGAMADTPDEVQDMASVVQAAGTNVYGVDAPLGFSFSGAVASDAFRMGYMDTDAMVANLETLAEGNSLARDTEMMAMLNAMPDNAIIVAATKGEYVTDALTLSLNILPEDPAELNNDDPTFATFYNIIREGAVDIAANPRNYSGYAALEDDGLYMQLDFDIVDQAYVVAMELLKIATYDYSAMYDY